VCGCRLLVGLAPLFPWRHYSVLARGLLPRGLVEGGWVGVVGRPLLVHMSALVAGVEVPGVWSVVDGHSVVAGQGHG
jgi:hypothetical protein